MRAIALLVLLHLLYLAGECFFACNRLFVLLWDYLRKRDVEFVSANARLFAGLGAFRYVRQISDVLISSFGVIETACSGVVETNRRAHHSCLAILL